MGLDVLSVVCGESPMEGKKGYHSHPHELELEEPWEDVPTKPTLRRRTSAAAGTIPLAQTNHDCSPASVCVTDGEEANPPISRVQPEITPDL